MFRSSFVVLVRVLLYFFNRLNSALFLLGGKDPAVRVGGRFFLFRVDRSRFRFYKWK